MFIDAFQTFLLFVGQLLDLVSARVINDQLDNQIRFKVQIEIESAIIYTGDHRLLFINLCTLGFCKASDVIGPRTSLVTSSCLNERTSHATVTCMTG